MKNEGSLLRSREVETRSDEVQLEGFVVTSLRRGRELESALMYGNKFRGKALPKV
jgi:hypothetical protein